MPGLAELKVQFEQFASNRYVQGGKDFLNSNNIIAKFAFLILVLILFFILFNLGSMAITSMFSVDHNPILVDGMINAKQSLIIRQNPALKGAVPILRSVNQRNGIEFTWSAWIYADDSNFLKSTPPDTKYKHIFHKGSDVFKPDGIANVLNAPGLYFAPLQVNAEKGNFARIRIVMNSFNTVYETVDIDDMPLNKWFHIVIRVTQQNNLDVFINSSLIKRHILSGVPKQNFGDVFVAMNGGFSGNIASLRYFEKAIGSHKINKLFKSGPNKKFIAGTMDVKADTNSYLSTRWYLKSAVNI